MTLVHQIVLGSDVPPLNRDCLESWQALEAWGFTLVRWTDLTARDLLDGFPPDVSSLYRSARNAGERSDILRFAIAYLKGGIYVDWDVMLLDPEGFVRVLREAEGSEAMFLQDLQDDADVPRSLDNSLFSMSEGNPLALDFLAEMSRNLARTPVLRTPFVTGTAALTRFIDTHPEHERACTFIATRAVYRFDYGDVLQLTEGPEGRATLREFVEEDRGRPGAPAVHFWTHAWVPGPTVLQRMRVAVSRVLRSRARR